MLERLDTNTADTEAQQVDPEWQPRRVTALRSCLEELTERVRAILALKYQERMPSKDIAERFGMKTNAVDMTLSRARRVLEDCVNRRQGRMERVAGE